MLRPLTILLWVSIILPTAVAAAIVWRSYDQTLVNAASNGAQTASLLREHALRVFEVQEHAIRQVEARIANMSWDEIEASPDTHVMLRTLATESPHIDAVWLVRPDGRRIDGTGVGAEALGAEQFQPLAEHDGLEFGRVARGQLGEATNFSISRRRTTSDGRFDGLVAVTSKLSYFESFWKGVANRQPHLIAIIRIDGDILARFPAVQGGTVKLGPDAPFHAAIRAADTGLYEYRSVIDGRDRIYSFARLGEHPAAVLVGLDRQTVLEPWKQSAAAVIPSALATVLLLCGVVQIARRRERHLSAEVERRRRAESTLIAKEEHVAALERATTALHASEERFRSVYEQAAVGIERLDLDGRIIDVNQALCATLGYRREELIGRDVATITDPEDLAAEREPLRRLLAGEIDRCAVEKRYIRKDGGRVWVRVTSSLVRAGGAEGTGRLSIVEDISRRQAVETALRNSEERFRRLFEAAPFGVMMIDPDTLVTVAFNDPAPAMLGYTRAEFARLTVADLDSTKPCEAIVRNQRAIVESGTRVTFETRLAAKSGELHDVIVSALPVEIDGKTYIYGGLVDITDRKRIERELAEAKEQAEQANLAKSKFLAAASHDLRQPLQSLFLFAHVLQAQVGEGGKAQGTLGALQKGLDVMKGLLDSLLDVSRLDAGSVTADIRSMPIGDVLEAIDTAYARIAANKGLSWQVEPCAAVVHSDPTLLGQLLRNLIENAIRYTSRGAIRLACREEGERLFIEVHDTGIGIPSEHLDRIWEEFHQVGNPERDREKGLGLGLAIVRRLSVLLGHPVTVRSQPGKGSVFAVEVPVDADGVVEEAAEPARRAEFGARAKLVAIVEDDAMVLVALEALLAEWGYEVLSASSGSQAVERITADDRRPDIIVSDYRLRAGEVGTEAIRRIRRACGVHIPGVLLTGETAGTVLRHAADEGLTVVHKPVLPSELDNALHQQLMAAEV